MSFLSQLPGFISSQTPFPYSLLSDYNIKGNASIISFFQKFSAMLRVFLFPFNFKRRMEEMRPPVLFLFYPFSCSFLGVRASSNKNIILIFSFIPNTDKSPSFL
jgi:hypothetical protein